MTETERIEIERACERLTQRYCHLVDHGEAERVADLFTKDGVWASPENTMNGQEEIRKGFARRQAQTGRMSRHVCTSFLLDEVEADRATGCVYLTLYRHDGDEGRRLSPLEGPEMVGEYRDRFERTPDGWRIAHREIGVSFLKRRD